MNKKPYAWLDGIPDSTSDLHNDAGFLNENEVDSKCIEWLDLDNAEDGQFLSVAVDGESKMPYWTDGAGMPSGEHSGDILVWNGAKWESRPKWQLRYQPVEYIESTGTQWIDSLYTITNNTGLRYKASHFDFGDEQDLYFTGGRVTGGTRFTIGYYHGNWDYGFNGYYVSDIQADTSVITEFKLNYKNNRKFVVNEQIGSDITDTIVNSTANIGLFSMLYETQFTAVNYPHRLYETEITDGETVVRHFVPVYSVLDDTIGMYETVEGKFYGNSGAGTFLKGADV